MNPPMKDVIFTVEQTKRLVEKAREISLCEWKYSPPNLNGFLQRSSYFVKQKCNELRVRKEYAFFDGPILQYFIDVDKYNIHGKIITRAYHYDSSPFVQNFFEELTRYRLKMKAKAEKQKKKNERLRIQRNNKSVEDFLSTLYGLVLFIS